MAGTTQALFKQLDATRVELVEALQRQQAQGEDARKELARVRAEADGLREEAASSAAERGRLQDSVAQLDAGAPVLGSWVGERRLFHHYLFLSASRVVLPKILVLTAV